MVETDHLAEDFDGLSYTLVPGLLALPLPCVVADVFVVSLVPAHRVMGELEMGHDFAVAKDRRAGAGSKRQHHFNSLALDRAKTLDIGIVEDPDRLTQMLREHSLQIEARQRLGAEIGSGQNPPTAHIAGEADRYSLERAKWRYHLVDGADEILRRDRFGWRRHPLSLADHVTNIVEQR